MGKISTAEVPSAYAQDRLFDFAPQALCHAINLRGASLRMTILWEN
jgi:hypothetical protein